MVHYIEEIDYKQKYLETHELNTQLALELNQSQLKYADLVALLKRLDDQKNLIKTFNILTNYPRIKLVFIIFLNSDLSKN